MYFFHRRSPPLTQDQVPEVRGDMAADSIGRRFQRTWEWWRRRKEGRQQPLVVEVQEPPAAAKAGRSNPR